MFCFAYFSGNGKVCMNAKKGYLYLDQQIARLKSTDSPKYLIQ